MDTSLHRVVLHVYVPTMATARGQGFCRQVASCDMASRTESRRGKSGLYGEVSAAILDAAERVMHDSYTALDVYVIDNKTKR